jgi:hypothetical protein
MYHVHRSEVNIYRVMTRNVSAVFKEESTLGGPTLIRCSGPPRARDSEGGGIKEGKFIKEGFFYRDL